MPLPGDAPIAPADGEAAVVLPSAEGPAGKARRTPWRQALRSTIGLKLLASILLFSSAVTLVLTALQLYLDYQRDLGAIETRFTEIERSYGTSLGAGLWNVDVAQLELQLQGILRLPEIRSVELAESPGGVQAPLRLRAGAPPEGRGIAREFPISHLQNGELRRLGTLRVHATLEEVYRRLLLQAEVILLSQAVKTFLVSLFTLLLVHLLVTRHLAELAAFVTRFDLRRAGPPLRLDRSPRPEPDELDRVVEAFNQMSVYLHRAYADLEEANAALESDINLRRGMEERLRRQAHYDSLTALPNRILLLERLSYATHRAARLGVRGALLSIDLDRFKDINDSRGHAVGDELLKEAARRLSACLGETDTLARLGGDEFAVIAGDLPDAAAAEATADRLLAAFAAPFPVAGGPHYLTASLGITLFPEEGEDPLILLRNAELAMYRAKGGGRNRRERFREEFNQALTEQLALEARLRGALARRELAIFYQPILAIRDRRPIAREALLRWRMEDGRLCPPDRFIPLAEEMGLIGDFGRWVLASACADLAAAADGDLRVAVNVSPRQLQEEGFTRFVAGELARHGLTPARLELEITERVVMDDSPVTRANLDALCALGVRLSIDDFGTGYSSLAYLQKYPFNTLKIDRSFVNAALTQPSAARLIETIVAMGHALGQEVIAEGIETEEQLAFLASAGCDLAQGFLLGRPAPLAVAG